MISHYCFASKRLILIFVWIIIPCADHAQPVDLLTFKYDASYCESTSNQLAIELEPGMIHRIHKSKGKKFTVPAQSVVINDQLMDVISMELHGGSSLGFQRKSFKFKLDKKTCFFSDQDTFRLKEFLAISLNMDRDYVYNKISFAVLSHLGLDVPRHTYAHLILNGLSEGIYLVTDKPHEFAFDQLDAICILRRGYESQIDKIKDDGVSNEETNMIKKRFKTIYLKHIKKYTGEKLYHKLSEDVDLSSYFTWLNFNYLFQNGDYSDEVYFYVKDAQGRFKIIPWDFDDLMLGKPHEGWTQRNQLLGNRLIYSSEDKLDQIIANDPVLYGHYLENFSVFLANFSCDDLKNILEQVYFELYPYYTRKEVIVQSQYDKFGLTNIDALEANLAFLYQFICYRMIAIEKKLDEEYAKISRGD